MDTIWVLLCGCLVFFMQAGFTCYEAGFVQSKNVISVAIENMLNLTITIVLYALVGFPLMFGTSVLERGVPAEAYAFFFLQMMFAATSVTIFAGALSERTKLAPLLIAGALSASVIYPVFGSWVWGDLAGGRHAWLERLGFIDFAGASVVHMTAGFIALAGLWVVGRRTEVHAGKSNIPLSVLGIFILWFGWFGFNGGLDSDVATLGKIFVNMTLAAACGTMGALGINIVLRRRGGYLISLFNGVLGGLVAITALSAYCTPPASMALGVLAGIFADLSSLLVRRLGLDDVVNVVPTHLVGGITGCLLCPFVMEAQYLQADDRMAQFGVQCLGVLANFVWAFGMAWIAFELLERMIGLRVTAEQERKGLNIVEFSDIYSWQNYMETSSYEKEIQEKNQLLRKQSRLLAVTEEQEKDKLAKDLHDSLGQSLSALKVILGMGRAQAIKDGDEAMVKNSDQAVRLADISIKEMRNVINNLRPEILEKNGLKAGLEALVGNLDQMETIHCSLQVRDELPFFDRAEELNLYRLVQEALTNVVKHACAKEVTVIGRRSSKEGIYQFIVRDDGIGFTPDSKHSGVGLSSMEDRLRMMGGRLRINSAEGEGTEIRMEVPY